MNDKFDLINEFAQQNDITTDDLNAYVCEIKNELRRQNTLAKEKEKLEYVNKCYLWTGADDTKIYYKVISPMGFYYDSISCIYFGEKPVPEINYDFEGIRGEVILSDESMFDVGYIDMAIIRQADEISAEEFEQALTVYMKEILHLDCSKIKM